MSAPGGLGQLCQLFTANPALHYRQITILANGHIDIAVDGGTGIVHDWARALPNRRESVGLASTAYGSTEAVVLTEELITVTVRPPFTGGAC